MQVPDQDIQSSQSTRDFHEKKLEYTVYYHHGKKLSIKDLTQPLYTSQQYVALLHHRLILRVLAGRTRRLYNTIHFVNARM